MRKIVRALLSVSALLLIAVLVLAGPWTALRVLIWALLAISALAAGGFPAVLAGHKSVLYRTPPNADAARTLAHEDADAPLPADRRIPCADGPAVLRAASSCSRA